MLLLIGFIIFPMIVLADDGPKPSIDVHIKNLNTSNYLIDLFVYDETGKKYESKANYNGDGLTDEQINKLHSLNFDGWISESTRWGSYLLFADCAGNNKYNHTFSYFGTPKRYKIVIINNDTNDIKISNEIIRDSFNSNISIDYNTMNTTNTIIKDNTENIVSNENNYLKTIAIALVCLIITVCVELLIAVIFKIGNYKIVIITNIVTNLGLQLALIVLLKNYLLTFIVGEVLVIIIELLVYLLKFKNISKLKTIVYALSSNIVTVIISLLTYKI